MLRSKDRKYEVRRTLADDLGRDAGALVLCFPDPDELRRLHEAELARGRDREDETFPGLEEPE